MTIAVPIKNNRSCSDLNSCDLVTIFSFNNNRVESEKQIKVSFDEVDISFKWLTELNIDMVITGTIDSRLNEYLQKHKIQAITGAPIANPQMLAEFYAM